MNYYRSESQDFGRALGTRIVVIPRSEATRNLKHHLLGHTIHERAHSAVRWTMAVALAGITATSPSAWAAPQAVARADHIRTVEERTVTLDGRLSVDSSGIAGTATNLTYLWSQIGGDSVGGFSCCVTNPVLAFVVPTIPSGSSVTTNATLTFQLVVTDTNAVPATNTVKVRVFLKGDLNRNETVNVVDKGIANANFGRFLNP